MTSVDRAAVLDTLTRLDAAVVDTGEPMLGVSLDAEEQDRRHALLLAVRDAVQVADREVRALPGSDEVARLRAAAEEVLNFLSALPIYPSVTHAIEHAAKECRDTLRAALGETQP